MLIQLICKMSYRLLEGGLWCHGFSVLHVV
jgi:hypothetical protein